MMIFSKRPSPPGNFLKMGGVSFFVHLLLVAFLSFNPWPSVIKPKPTALMVTLMPIPFKEPEIQKPTPSPVPKEEISKPVEKRVPVEKPKVEKPKKDDIVEKVRKTPPKKDEVAEKAQLKRLQEAIEEIRKKAAIEDIKKRVARREKKEERPMNTPVSTPPVSVPVPSVPAPVPMTPSPVLSPPSPQKPMDMDSKLSAYYSLVWAKIKASWTIPENLLKEKVDLETIIVLIIERNGTIQKSWFEKKSGDEVYDQMAMRAIKRADPLPPMPRELSENVLELGIRFFPD